MRKSTVKERRIIALAYLHRYGWIVPLVLCIAVCPEQTLCILSVACLSHSVWSFVGYKMKWKHIYCSFQNAYHHEMTPNNIQWHKIKSSDAYGLPLVFFIMGLISLAVLWD